MFAYQNYNTEKYEDFIPSNACYSICSWYDFIDKTES